MYESTLWVKLRLANTNKSNKQTKKPTNRNVYPTKARRSPQAKTTKPRKTLSRRKIAYGKLASHLGEENYRGAFFYLRTLEERYPRCPRVQNWMRSLVSAHNLRVVGDASLSDDVTTITEAPFDLPPVPYNNSTPILRKCRIQKLANQGTVGGGLSAYLTVADLTPFTQGSGNVCRVKQVTSWTIPRYNTPAQGAEFSSVNIPAQTGSTGTEVMPTWESNFTRVGQGFSGLVTKFPLGDLPLFTQSEGTTNILQHFVGDGFTSGSATEFLSVVFDVLLDVLI